ncbi:hypothetical protein BD413DRAFT_566754 [Trametes elegans]|nr:hypothetical protein BD413DRAFT_566754 [Trametes elegans]
MFAPPFSCLTTVCSKGGWVWNPICFPHQVGRGHTQGEYDPTHERTMRMIPAEQVGSRHRTDVKSTHCCQRSSRTLDKMRCCSLQRRRRSSGTLGILQEAVVDGRGSLACVLADGSSRRHSRLNHPRDDCPGPTGGFSWTCTSFHYESHP